jgi:hypothetical protein
MAIPISSSVASVNPQELFYSGYELNLDAIVPSTNLSSSFIPSEDTIEFYIYTKGKTLLYSKPNYQDYIVPDQIDTSLDEETYPPRSSTAGVNGMETSDPSSYSVPVYSIELDPVNDIYFQGYSTGDYFALYNFLRYEVGSLQPYFISEISSDRTELRLKNNYITNNDISTLFATFKDQITNEDYKDEYYINFGENNLFIAVNTELELAENGEASILIKLYKPLPSSYSDLDTCSIVTKVAETVAYEVKFTQDLGTVDDLTYIAGPNINIPVADKVNNSSIYKSYSDLTQTKNSSSKYLFDQLKNQRGVQIKPNYSDWSKFVHFSSAEQRLTNFHTKVKNIESYKAELASLDSVTGDVTASTQYSQSKATQDQNIIDTIKTFDGYDYFLYYMTSSNSWPKSTSTYPYELYSYSSSQVKNWIGTTDETGAYFSSGKNMLYSASLYDENNKDYLYHLIPPFINSDTDNTPYIKFTNMVGQAFDEMYLYTEALSNVRSTTNALTGSRALPLEMADEAVESMGWETYGNSFNSQLFDPANVGVLPPTGSGQEYISRYVDITSGSIVNYYDKDFTTLGYIVQLLDPGNPYPINNQGQEIYKRVYANMVSLVKRKGTITGLRQLINIWGVPATMLRISEFGGKNRDDENDYDLWQDRYSTAFTSYATKNTESVYNTADYKAYEGNTSANVSIPWQCLTGNYTADSELAVADCIQFRFKTAEKVDGTTSISRSLLLKQGNPFESPPGTEFNGLGNGEFGITLEQSGSNSGSYSGSVDSSYNTYASMSFVISGSVLEGALGTGYFKTDPIYLPFFNGDWWSVQIQRLAHIPQSGGNNVTQTYELRVGQNGYDGNDGNKIKYKGVVSMSLATGGAGALSSNRAWNKMEGAANSVKGMNIINESNLLIPGSIITDTGNNGSINQIGDSPSYSNPSYHLGDSLSGSFQEVRFYRRAVSASAFYDYVMNPRSIQGQRGNYTGSGTSYDLLAFRAPLGNELEFNNQGAATASMANNLIGGGSNPYDVVSFFYGEVRPYETPNNSGSSLGSVHPSVVNMKGSLYTSSFINKADTQYTSSTYAINYRVTRSYAASSSISASYLEPINDVVYLDQPSAGLKNRISNKIQVKDKNEYGYILTPDRSIQQNRIQSQSYTEDINSLEVGFSFQNEINDDIISTFGHGVVSHAVGDPRFISESGDRYPILTKIADDYFKKYQGLSTNNPESSYQTSLREVRPGRVEDEFDYNRLIKFYETSLFRAIKNYMPARTSLNTGIIIKPHLLERSRHKLPSVTINTPVAITPETGSLNNLTSSRYGGDNLEAQRKGFNSPMIFNNLVVTGSVAEFSDNPTIVKVRGSSGMDTRLNSLYTSSRNYRYPWYSQIGNYDKIPDDFGLGPNYAIKAIGSGSGTWQELHYVLNGYDSTFPLTPSYFYGAESANTPGYNFTPANAGEYRQLYNGKLGSASESPQFNEMISKNVVEYDLPSRFGPGGKDYSTLSDSSGSIVPLYSINTSFRFAFVWDDSMGATLNQPIFIQIRSEQRGVILTYESTYSHAGNPNYDHNSYETPSTEIYAGEQLSFHVRIDNQNWQIQSYRVEFGGKYKHINNDGTTYFAGFPDSDGPDTWEVYYPPSHSVDIINTDPNHNMPQQGWFGSTETKYGLITSSFINNNDEFYNGEFSGSHLNWKPVDWYEGKRYNPYRVFADGNNFTPDGPLQPTCDFNNAGGTGPSFSTWWTVNDAFNIEVNTGWGDMDENQYATGSFANIIEGYQYVWAFRATNVVNPTGFRLFAFHGTDSLGNYTGQYIPSSGFYKLTFTADSTSVAVADGGLGRVGFLFFSSSPVGGEFEHLYIKNIGPAVGKKYLLPRDSYKINPTYSQVFRNSQYNPILNNVSGSRTNKFYQDVDYASSQYIPVNIDSIIRGTALTASVQESNYTTEKVIRPRYKGSKNNSLNYNVPTPPVSNSYLRGGKVEFLNNDTGSWGGDTVPTETAIVKNPQFMAHFKTSYEYRGVFDTMVFEIDQLIEVPNEDLESVASSPVAAADFSPKTLVVSPTNKDTTGYPPFIAKDEGTGKETFIITASLAVQKDDNGLPMYAPTMKEAPPSIEIEDPMPLELLSSIFEVNRRCTIDYDNAVVGGIDWAPLTATPKLIYQGGAEYITKFTNEITRYSQSVTASYDPALFWKTAFPQVGIGGASGTYVPGVTYSFKLRNTAASGFGIQYGKVIVATTGSFRFNLSGSNITAYDLTGDFNNQGPGLAVLHNYNHIIKNQLGTSSLGSMVPPGLDPNVGENYFRMDKVLMGCEDYDKEMYPFYFDRGDEVRISYRPNLSGFASGKGFTVVQDFKVMQTSQSNNILQSVDYGFYVPAQTIVQVHPNPQTLKYPVDDGEVPAMTLRKKIGANNRVIVRTPNLPSGSKGVNTKSGGGFLIPFDFSAKQKQNAQILINNLRAKNAFKDDTNIDSTKK